EGGGVLDRGMDREGVTLEVGEQRQAVDAILGDDATQSSVGEVDPGVFGPCLLGLDRFHRFRGRGVGAHEYSAPLPPLAGLQRVQSRKRRESTPSASPSGAAASASGRGTPPCAVPLPLRRSGPHPTAWPRPPPSPAPPVPRSPPAAPPPVASDYRRPR